MRLEILMSMRMEVEIWWELLDWKDLRQDLGRMPYDAERGIITDLVASGICVVSKWYVTSRAICMLSFFEDNFLDSWRFREVLWPCMTIWLIDPGIYHIKCKTCTSWWSPVQQKREWPPLTHLYQDKDLAPQEQQGSHIWRSHPMNHNLKSDLMLVTNLVEL